VAGLQREGLHADFLRSVGGSVRVDRVELSNLPQLRQVIAAERGVVARLVDIDRPFAGWAPASRLFKLIADPTMTDIDRGQARVGLARVEALTAFLAARRAR
jgi:hypothetical protein